MTKRGFVFLPHFDQNVIILFLNFNSAKTKSAHSIVMQSAQQTVQKSLLTEVLQFIPSTSKCVIIDMGLRCPLKCVDKKKHVSSRSTNSSVIMRWVLWGIEMRGDITR